MKNLYGTLSLFSRVALDDNIHFQILELEGPPIVTNNGLVFGETPSSIGTTIPGLGITRS